MNKCVVYLARFLRAVLFLACLKSRGFCGGVDSDSGDGGDLLTSTIPLTGLLDVFHNRLYHKN